MTKQNDSPEQPTEITEPARLATLLATAIQADDVKLMATAILAHTDSRTMPASLKTLCGNAVFNHETPTLAQKHIRSIAEIFLAHELSA